MGYTVLPFVMGFLISQQESLLNNQDSMESNFWVLLVAHEIPMRAMGRSKYRIIPPWACIGLGGMVEYSGCLPMSLEAHVVLDLSLGWGKRGRN